jgi:hypothetical protein
MMNRVLLLLVFVFLTACAPPATPLMTVAPTKDLEALIANAALPSRTPKPLVTILPTSTVVSSSTATPQAVKSVKQNSETWKTWPVIPTVDESVRKIYEYGQSLGNDPHAFSIFGDCQTRPDDFFGVFENDPAIVASLSPELQETVQNFQGSFDRESSTAQDGTTPGALLWDQWHRGEYGCTFAETPVECELRTHRPSFVLIQVGTHFESRNTEYLRKIILQLMDAGVVPILATKADNREKDERINRDMAMLAAEYDLPLWNFWAAVSDLPNRGLYTRKDRPLQGDIYLTDEALLRHRMTGLAALNAVWRVATEK